MWTAQADLVRVHNVCFLVERLISFNEDVTIFIKLSYLNHSHCLLPGPSTSYVYAFQTDYGNTYTYQLHNLKLHIHIAVT